MLFAGYCTSGGLWNTVYCKSGGVGKSPHSESFHTSKYLLCGGSACVEWWCVAG